MSSTFSISRLPPLNNPNERGVRKIETLIKAKKRFGHIKEMEKLQIYLELYQQSFDESMKSKYQRFQNLFKTKKNENKFISMNDGNAKF